MATTPQQGIMALPETDEASTPQLSLNESYGAAKQGLSEANPQFAAMYQAEMTKVMPTLMALSDQELDTLLQLIQYLQDHPEEYAQRVQELEADGTLEKGSLPPEYDENFLATFGAAILEAQRTNEDTGAAAMQPPMQLAKGGIAEAARMVAGQGRSGDTMLAHITKDEAKLLRKHGGVGTLNPRTGLREYGLWSSIKSAVSSVGKTISGAVKAVGGAVKNVLSSSVGKIVATVALAAFLGPGALGVTGLGLGSTAAMGLASAGITALSGGNLKDVVKAGVTGAIAGFGAEVLGPALGSATGVTNAAGQAAMGAGAAGLGSGLLQGKSIKDSVKDGMTAAAVAGIATGATQGFGAQAPTNNAPVEDRSFTSADAKPQVNAQTGEVTGGAPVQPAPAQPTVQPPVAQAPASADPLGDFIQQNEAFRAAANTPVPAPEPTIWDQTKQAYNEYLSPSGREQIGLQQAKADALAGYRADIANGVPESLAAQNYQAALKAGTPGVLSTYGPAIGAGLGITALAGGFKPAEQPGMSDQAKDAISGKATQDIISANPKNYITQGLPGVTYDAAGNIVSSGSWTPHSGSGTTEVAGNYIGYTAPAQHAALPSVAPVLPSAAPAPQTYNFMPRYAAQGGMMETAGAFPANPLTMSNPAMAMHAQQMPMNTPGVPMNMPMGYAMGGMPVGGIASLAVGGYPRRTGQIDGPGTETSDSIPAMLSDGEFVMTAKAVKGLGGGSRRAGAKKMYALMHRLENNAARG